MDRFASTTTEDIACLVQEKDSDNISNIFIGKKAMQGYHFFTTGRVSPVFEEILCRRKEKGWDTYIIKRLLPLYTNGIL